MPDARFFDAAQPLSLATLAERTGAVLTRGEPETLIEIAAPLVHADGRGVAFLADRKYRGDLAASRAGARGGGTTAASPPGPPRAAWHLAR